MIATREEGYHWLGWVDLRVLEKRTVSKLMASTKYRVDNSIDIRSIFLSP